MKKVFLALTLVGMVACLASCGKKTCYCYSVDANGNQLEETVKVDEEESCVALSSISGQGIRACVEEEDRRQ